MIDHHKKNLLGINCASFFWSSSSLMVYAILPAYLSDEFQLKPSHYGMIEGLAVFLAFVAKVGAGVGCDHYARLPFIVVGSCVTTMTKLMFFTVPQLGLIYTARCLDRLGKGIRSAPADALLADLSVTGHRHQVYGTRQAIYTLGSVFGAATATAILHLYPGQYRFVFLLSIIPSILALIIVMYGIKEPKSQKTAQKKAFWPKISLDLKAFSKIFWLTLVMISFLMLARFSEGFLTLYAKSNGWQNYTLPVIIIVMDLSHVFFAAYCRRIHRRHASRLFFIAMLVMILANLILFLSTSVPLFLLALLLVGAHMGLAQSLIRSMVADAAPSKMKGTAFALFYVVCGIAVLLANCIAGQIADLSFRHVFLGGAIFTAIGLGLAIFLERTKRLHLGEIY